MPAASREPPANGSDGLIRSRVNPRSVAPGRTAWLLLAAERVGRRAAAAVLRLVAGHRLDLVFSLRLLLFLRLALLTLGHDGFSWWGWTVRSLQPNLSRRRAAGNISGRLAHRSGCSFSACSTQALTRSARFSAARSRRPVVSIFIQHMALIFSRVTPPS